MSTVPACEAGARKTKGAEPYKPDAPPTLCASGREWVCSRSKESRRVALPQCVTDAWRPPPGYFFTGSMQAMTPTICPRVYPCCSVTVVVPRHVLAV